MAKYLIEINDDELALIYKGLDLGHQKFLRELPAIRGQNCPQSPEDLLIDSIVEQVHNARSSNGEDPELISR